MSGKKDTPWHERDRFLRACATLSGYAGAVGGALWHHASSKTRRCFLSYRTISEVCGVSERQARRELAELRAAELVTWTPKDGRDGRTRKRSAVGRPLAVNEYTLHPVSVEKLAALVAAAKTRKTTPFQDSGTGNGAAFQDSRSQNISGLPDPKPAAYGTGNGAHFGSPGPPNSDSGERARGTAPPTPPAGEGGKAPARGAGEDPLAEALRTSPAELRRASADELRAYYAILPPDAKARFKTKYEQAKTWATKPLQAERTAAEDARSYLEQLPTLLRVRAALPDVQEPERELVADAITYLQRPALRERLSPECVLAWVRRYGVDPTGTVLMDLETTGQLAAARSVDGYVAKALETDLRKREEAGWTFCSSCRHLTVAPVLRYCVEAHCSGEKQANG